MAVVLTGKETASIREKLFGKGDWINSGFSFENILIGFGPRNQPGYWSHRFQVPSQVKDGRNAVERSNCLRPLTHG